MVVTGGDSGFKNRQQLTVVCSRAEVPPKISA
jgi:hypothetical protein